MFDVTTGSDARSTLEALAAAGVDVNDPAVRDGLLALAREVKEEEKSARERAFAAITPALTALADAVATQPEYRHVSKTRVSETTGKVSGGNAGYRVEWAKLPDGRKITVHVLDAKE